MSVSPMSLWCNRESQANQEHIVRSHLIKSESLNAYNANTSRDTIDRVEMRPNIISRTLLHVPSPHVD